MRVTAASLVSPLPLFLSPGSSHPCNIRSFSRGPTKQKSMLEKAGRYPCYHCLLKYGLWKGDKFFFPFPTNVGANRKIFFHSPKAVQTHIRVKHPEIVRVKGKKNGKFLPLTKLEICTCGNVFLKSDVDGFNHHKLFCVRPSWRSKKESDAWMVEKWREYKDTYYLSDSKSSIDSEVSQVGSDEVSRVGSDDKDLPEWVIRTRETMENKLSKLQFENRHLNEEYWLMYDDDDDETWSYTWFNGADASDKDGNAK